MQGSTKNEYFTLLSHRIVNYMHHTVVGNAISRGRNGKIIRLNIRRFTLDILSITSIRYELIVAITMSVTIIPNKIIAINALIFRTIIIQKKKKQCDFFHSSALSAHLKLYDHFNFR